MDPVRPMLGGTVLTLAVYPEKGAPGRPLTEASIGTEGLDGDRRKKRPVHVVGRDENPDVTRANIFLDVSDDALQHSVGQELRVGPVILKITELPSNCPGVYASVRRGGVVRVGDRIS